MRKSYHSTAVPITLAHTIRRKLAASSGATFRVTSSATVIDVSKKYRRQGKQLVLSAEPIGSPDGKNSIMFTVGNQRRGTRQMPSGAAKHAYCPLNLLFTR